MVLAKAPKPSSATYQAFQELFEPRRDKDQKKMAKAIEECVPREGWRQLHPERQVVQVAEVMQPTVVQGSRGFRGGRWRKNAPTHLAELIDEE